MHSMKKEEIAYIAGFFDGEGCVSVMKRITKRPYGRYWTYSIYVRMANTNLDVLQWMQDRIGGAIYEHNKKASLGNRKAGWILHLQGERARRFLETIEPYCIVKLKQIALAKQFFDLGDSHVPSVRAEFYEQMKELNFRGIKANKTANGSAPVISGPMPMEV